MLSSYRTRFTAHRVLSPASIYAQRTVCGHPPFAAVGSAVEITDGEVI